MECREVLRLLQKASSLQENFLWQSHALGKSVIPIYQFEIDFVSRGVVIYFNTKLYSIDKHLPVYVKLDYRESIFKINNHKQGKDALHFSFPDEIKTIEMREQLRSRVPPSDERYISLRPSLSGNINESMSTLKARVIDLSYGGAGLTVTEQNRSFLKNNRILWITKVHEVNLKFPILAEVVYMNTDIDLAYRNKRAREIRVGLKFSDALAEEVYRQCLC